jgi:hypothetical protein
MKERPILFSGEMVRAILDGRKTMTRRVVKFHNLLGEPDGWCHNLPGVNKIVDDYTRYCPYGMKGERLWVKETHCKLDPDLHGPLGVNEKIVYRADNLNQDEDSKRIMREYGYKWKPSIFMRRVDSRITLEIVSVRVERLQDISEEDAKREGVDGYFGTRDNSDPSYRCAYRLLWEKINGAGSWEANPWVWVIEFKRVVL